MSSPTAHIALSIYRVKNNLGGKCNYLVLIIDFCDILFLIFLFVLFLTSFSDQNGSYKMLCSFSNSSLRGSKADSCKNLFYYNSSYNIFVEETPPEDIPSFKLNFGLIHVTSQHNLLYSELEEL